MRKQQRMIDAHGLPLSMYEWKQSGKKQATIVLIHGYPDSAHAWDAVAQTLAQHFHVVSYDVRGTGLSGIPNSRKDYGFEHLIADLKAVIDTVSPDQAVHLVGHDWGALQGWEAIFSPSLCGRIASFSTLAPSLDHVGLWFQTQLNRKTWRGYKNALKQAAGSSYMGLFQLPWLPEFTWWTGLDQAWWLVVSQLENVVVAPSPTQLKDATHGLGLYRQNLLKPLLHPQTRHTDIPIHSIVMSNDPFVPMHLFDDLAQTCSNYHRSNIAAGHWGILSQPSQIADTIARYVLTQFDTPSNALSF
jgi:pimeloyl-ACP methyl ester carboxylesterase